MRFIDPERVLLNDLNGLVVHDPYPDQPVDRTITSYLVLDTGFTDTLPAVLVTRDPAGEESAWEQVAQVTVQVYADGVLARDIASLIAERYNATDVTFPDGYVDSIRPVIAPHSLPYTDPSIRLASVTLQLVSRIQ